METKGDGRQRRRRLAGCFLKVKFHFLSTYFPPFCDTPPPARLHPVVHRSTFNSPTLPQNIHFSSSSLRFFFHQHNKHRPLGEQCKSRNSVKLLRNAVVMFPYPSPAPIYCRSTAKLRVFAFLRLFSSHSPSVMSSFVWEKKWRQRRFYGCLWRHQSSLQTLLSHFLLSKEGSIKFLTIDQSDSAL